ncbi:MAG: hypothetical protein ACK55I_45305, partial [bacterium]
LLRLAPVPVHDLVERPTHRRGLALRPHERLGTEAREAAADRPLLARGQLEPLHERASLEPGHHRGEFVGHFRKLDEQFLLLRDRFVERLVGGGLALLALL